MLSDNGRETLSSCNVLLASGFRGFLLFSWVVGSMRWLDGWSRVIKRKNKIKNSARARMGDTGELEIWIRNLRFEGGGKRRGIAAKRRKGRKGERA